MASSVIYNIKTASNNYNVHTATQGLISTKQSREKQHFNKKQPSQCKVNQQYRFCLVSFSLNKTDIKV